LIKLTYGKISRVLQDCPLPPFEFKCNNYQHPLFCTVIQLCSFAENQRPQQVTGHP
jgi:hypothetical protein